MPLKKILFRPGVNRENTRYASEALGAVQGAAESVGGWYESEKIRFRAGTPEKIGGWAPYSTSTFLGNARSLWNWITLAGQNLLGIGTNLKFYIEQGGAYFDITPIRTTTTLGTNPFTANGTQTITVTAPSHGAVNGDFVTFSGATAFSGVTINGEYEIAYVNDNSYTIQYATNVTAGSGGGSSVSAQYQINVGPAYEIPLVGWGAGKWGAGAWGVGAAANTTMRLWSQSNFGEDLVYAPAGGQIYYWSAAAGVGTRGVPVSSLGGTVTITIASPAVVTASVALNDGTGIQFATTGALPTGITAGTTYYVSSASGNTFQLTTSAGAVVNTSGTQSGVQSISSIVDVPSVQNFIFVSDVSRFTMAFGCNDYGSSIQDPMLIRWSDQESVVNWSPSATNQAGSVRLSHGSKIVSAVQTRQEIVVFTDASVYSLQYQGPPVVWGAQLLGDNISILGQNAAVIASGRVFWMGVDKFYVYDGRVQTLRCDLRQYIYSDINLSQNLQVFAGTSEGFNEVWWFYCSENSTTIDKYVIYNYLEDVWYYGTMARTAWLDSGLRDYPIATSYVNSATQGNVTTYGGRVLNHEYGVDDNVDGNPQAMTTLIASTEFDIDDGHNFGFVYRILPDLTFRGSTGSNTPQVTMTLIPLANSGSGYNNPQSEGGSSNATIQRIASAPVEQFTGQVFIRVRGRQMVFRLDCSQLGTQWQLGAPRIDIRKDGRRGNT